MKDTTLETIIKLIFGIFIICGMTWFYWELIHLIIEATNWLQRN